MAKKDKEVKYNFFCKYCGESLDFDTKEELKEEKKSHVCSFYTYGKLHIRGSLVKRLKEQMEKFKCKKCKKIVFSANKKSKTKCPYCGGTEFEHLGPAE